MGNVSIPNPARASTKGPLVFFSKWYIMKSANFRRIL